MVKILDTTLREGEQTPGVKFSLEQKLEIAKELDAFGVDYIEAGMPIISDYDFQAVKAVANLGLKAEVLGHARARKEDIDAVADSGCKWVGIFCGINDLSRKYKLNGKSKGETYAMIDSAVSYAKHKGLNVRFTVEDSTRTSGDNLIEIAKIVRLAGADRFSIADTIGCGTPDSVLELITNLKKISGMELEFHGHNDLGLANANSLAASKAGASVIDVTVNGLGERAGLTSLQEFCTARKVLYGENTKKYTLLSRLSELVKRCSGVDIDSLRPIVGDNAFTHTAKLHRDAMIENPECYEFIAPSLIGRDRKMFEKKSIPLQELIGKPFIKSASELIGHREGQGTRYVFLDHRNVPETSLYIILREVKDIRDEQSHVDAHIHNCDSAFLFIGKNPNLTGLGCEVQLGDEKHMIESPASVFIPKGLKHSYRLVRGGGYYANIVLSPDYNKSIR